MARWIPVLVISGAAGTGLILGVGADAHQTATGWTYPPACCKNNTVTGDCQKIPSIAVRTGPNGFTVLLRPGDHRLVTRRQVFLIPYGDEIPSGDRDFHICLHPTEDHANCFFAPPDGV